MPNGLYTGRNRVVGGTGIGIVALVPLIAIPNSVVAGVLYGMITGMILRYLSCRLFSNSNAWISFFTVPSSAIFPVLFVLHTCTSTEPGVIEIFVRKMIPALCKAIEHAAFSKNGKRRRVH